MADVLEAEGQYPGKQQPAFFLGPTQSFCGGTAALTGLDRARQPHTYEFPSCGSQGLFLSCLAHPGRVFPSNDALFLHPAISAEECDVLSEAETPKPPLWFSCLRPQAAACLFRFLIVYVCPQ